MIFNWVEDLTSNVKILKMIHKRRKLSIYEALVIIDKQPALNRHVDNFINPLKLFARSNNNHETFVAAHTRNDTRVDGYVNAMLRHLDISCVQDDVYSSCTPKFIDVCNSRTKFHVLFFFK